MMKPKSEFEWEETGKLRIRSDNGRSAALRFFPSNKVISKTLAKFTKNDANQSNSENGIIPYLEKKKQNTGNSGHKNDKQED